MSLGYAAILTVLIIACSFIGSFDWSPGEVFRSWREEVNPDGSTVFEMWFDFRIKRLLLAAFVGFILALSGLVFQAVLHNPLAEPYILGVSNGASLGVLATVVIGNSFWSEQVAAFAGGIASLLLVLAMASWGRFRDPVQIILSGVILNSILGSAILLLWNLSRPNQVMANLYYLMGGLRPEVYLETTVLWLLLAISIGLALLFASSARTLDILSLSEDEAADLGVKPARARLVALIAASLATSGAVAVVGPIGFVGLVIPHMLRLLHGSHHRTLVPLVGLAGAIFLVLADTGTRLFDQIMIGVVTSLIGGPFFLVLLVSRSRERAL